LPLIRLATGDTSYFRFIDSLSEKEEIAILRRVAYLQVHALEAIARGADSRTSKKIGAQIPQSTLKWALERGLEI
jgi:hypothetical protein